MKPAMKDTMTIVRNPLPRFLALIAALTGAALWLGVPALAQSNGLALLGTLTKGEWTIKYRDGSPERRICVRKGEEFIQLKHKQTDCNRFVVEDSAARVTVQYTCPGNGYGRTSIRRETPSLIQLESQGIVDGMPFQIAAEARRTGTC
jgi:hypothetical protein